MENHFKTKLVYETHNFMGTVLDLVVNLILKCVKVSPIITNVVLCGNCYSFITFYYNIEYIFII